MLELDRAYELTYAEWHDARIGQITLKPGVGIVITFAHVSCYYSVSPGEFLVMSCEAELELTGVKSFEVHDALLAEDYVSDGAISNECGSQFHLLNVPEIAEQLNLELAMAHGGRIVGHARRLKFNIIRSVECLERWKGSLPETISSG